MIKLPGFLILGEPGKPGEPGQDASANVSINKDGYIVIGDVVTSLKTDTKRCV